MPAKGEETIHDHLAEIPEQQRLGVVVDLVENPYKQGAHIRVLRATRDDPLAGLLARGQIDLAQHEAGRTWQRHWENAEIGAIHSIDPRNEPVDGSAPAREAITGKRIAACAELRQCAVMLGHEGDRIVRLVLGERLQIMEVALRHGRSKRYMGERFRECLETMAKLWCLA